jgi:ribonuclease HI
MLWSSQNGTNIGEPTRTPRVIAGQILGHCMDLKLLQQPSSNPGTTQSNWSRPPPDFLKINVDGSFVQTAGIGGWGIIVRDDVASVVGSRAGKIEHCTEAMQAEAMAVLHALSLASDAGMSRLLLETDAITIRTALTSNAYDLSPIGMIIRDIKYHMLTEFIEVKVVFQSRSSNLVADKLAEFGCQLNPGVVMV